MLRQSGFLLIGYVEFFMFSAMRKPCYASAFRGLSNDELQMMNELFIIPFHVGYGDIVAVSWPARNATILVILTAIFTHWFYCPHRQRIFGLRKITLYTSDITTGQTEFPTSETVRYKPYATFTPESLRYLSNSESRMFPLFTGWNINRVACYLSILQNWRYPIR
ncbi:hypothetical protein O5541_27330 [Escherichia coli]|nr:hypothetical protein [Escherichia coli]